MVENQLGKLIQYERKKAGISVKELCSGICSESFLFRVESGERKCERIVADALLQRMGISGSRFSYVMSPDEQKWMILKEQLIQVANEGKLKDVGGIAEKYEKITFKKSNLHKQFFLLAESIAEWKNGYELGKIQNKLEKAFLVTVPDMDFIMIKNRRMSLTELFILTTYGKIVEEQGEFQKAEYVYLAAEESMEKYTSKQDCVKLYAQVAYHVAYLLEKRGEHREALHYINKGLFMSKSQGSITYVRELLEQYNRLIKLKMIDVEEKEWQDEIKQNEKISQSLQDLYRVYHIQEKSWIWNIPYCMGEIELCNNTIKKRRKVLGISQEKLAEGICDPVTISRIECGRAKPKTNVLKEIMKKLGMAGESFVSWYQVNNPELLGIANEITDSLVLGELEKAELLLDKLRENVDLENIYVRQYFNYIEALTLLNLGKIDREEHWKRQKEALYLTLPKVPCDVLQNWVFSVQEVDIVNALSYSCEKMGKTEQIIKLLMLILQSYKKTTFSLDYYIAGMGLTARNLGNILGNSGKYEEAIEIADYGIYWALRKGDGLLLKVLLYDRGWNMEQMWKKGTYTQKESLQYIEQALMFNIFFENEEKRLFIQKHIEKIYTR